MKKPKQHPTSQKPERDTASTDTPRQGLDRDTAQRQQRDNMLTDTNATQSSEATGGPSKTSAGSDPRSNSRPASAVRSKAPWNPMRPMWIGMAVPKETRCPAAGAGKVDR
jgi:hypothetical protein